MKWFISQETIKAPFQKNLEKECGERVTRCYQCGKCSAGCPISFKMEYLPNQIIRMIQLGMEQEVLAANTIWLCASCITCTTRCPREIDIAEIMDYLRRYAYKKQIIPKEETGMPLFAVLFLRNIELFGRLYEMGLIAMFNLLSGEFFKDFAIAPKMFAKRKIGLLPRKIKNLREVKEVFKKSGELEKAKRSKLLRPKAIVLAMARGFIRKLERQR
jgi:heterodisulfide reductase subunit C2